MATGPVGFVGTAALGPLGIPPGPRDGPPR